MDAKQRALGGLRGIRLDDKANVKWLTSVIQAAEADARAEGPTREEWMAIRFLVEDAMARLRAREAITRTQEDDRLEVMALAACDKYAPKEEPKP